MIYTFLNFCFFFFFFFNDTATTEIYTLSLHDALPTSPFGSVTSWGSATIVVWSTDMARSEEHTSELQSPCNLVCRLLLEKKKTDVGYFTSLDDIEAARIRMPCVAQNMRKLEYAIATYQIVDPIFPCIFFFNDTATTEIYTLSLHDALPI